MTQIDLGRVIRGVDSILRQQLGVHDFTDDENCIFRIAVIRMPKELLLPDGTLVPKDAAVIELHFWNEHLPVMPDEGPDVAWAVRFNRQMRWSLTLLARHLDVEPLLADVVALTGATAFSSRIGAVQMVRAAKRFGLDVLEPEQELKPGNMVHLVLDSLFLWGLGWTFNRPGLRSKPLLRHRHQLWMSRAALHARYVDVEGVPSRAH